MRCIFNFLPDTLSSHDRIVGSKVVPTGTGIGLRRMKVNPFSTLSDEYAVIGVVITDAIAIDPGAIVGGHARGGDRVELEDSVGVVVVFTLDHFHRSSSGQVSFRKRIKPESIR